jgi:DnaJ-domain-containing protein 1
MTLKEMAAAFLCLVAGYWIVSSFMDWNARKKHEASGKGGGANGGRRSSAEPDPQMHSAPADASDSPLEWFQVLGVPEGATVEQITAAYKRRIGENHPDKVSQMGPEIRALAELRSKQINAAYDRALKVRG